MPKQLAERWMPRRRARANRFLVGVCAMMIALALTHSALADSARVAVIYAEPNGDAARRIRAEIRAAGLEAVDVSVPMLERRSTSKIAYGAGAVSALRVHADGSLEIIVLDLQTGEPLERSMVMVQGSSVELELRAVEDLRAKLIELSIVAPTTATVPVVPNETKPASEATPAPSGPKHAPTAEPRGVARVDTALPGSLSRSRRLAAWLQLATGGAFGSGGLGAASVARGGVRFEPAERWSVSALTLLPVSAHQVTTAQGAAMVDSYLFGATLGVVPVRSTELELDLGLGAGAALCAMRGVPASASDQGGSRVLWAAVGLADASLAWRANGWLRVRAALLVGVAVPRPVVRFDGEAVASWGRPLTSATLGIEVQPFGPARMRQ